MCTRSSIFLIGFTGFSELRDMPGTQCHCNTLLRVGGDMPMLYVCYFCIKSAHSEKPSEQSVEWKRKGSRFLGLTFL